jgi:hypothetical protein
MTGARRQAVLVVWGIAIVAVYCYGGVMVVLCCMAHGYVDGSRSISGNAMCACLSMSHVSCIVAADVMWDVCIALRCVTQSCLYLHAFVVR